VTHLEPQLSSGGTLAESTALKLGVPPGDYTCRFWIPGRDAGLVELPGELSLEAERPPKALVHGDVPLRHEELPGGASAAGFPQTTLQVIACRIFKTVTVAPCLYRPRRSRAARRADRMGER
jgi:hypothetical protein